MLGYPCRVDIETVVDLTSMIQGDGINPNSFPSVGGLIAFLRLIFSSLDYEGRNNKIWVKR